MIQPLFPESELPSKVERRAQLSPCGTYRFTLSRRWARGDTVCFIGLNPSTADHERDDPTVRRWTHFARAWGYDGFIAVNLYPFRSSSPLICKRWAGWELNGPDWHARDRIQQNMGIVATAAKQSALVVACWGAGAWDWDHADAVVEEIQAGEAPNPDIYCFEKTAAGCPMHPMARGKRRIADDAKPQLWKPA